MKLLASERTTGSDLFHNPPVFSLVLGGPLFQLLRRAHLADDALMMERQRLVVFTLLTWLPLLLLSILEGQAWGSRTVVPFLLDIEVHVRFLVALPLLVVATLAPIVPLALTMMSFEELLKTLFGVLF